MSVYQEAVLELALTQRDQAQGRLDAVRMLYTTRPDDPELAQRILRALGPAPEPYNPEDAA